MPSNEILQKRPLKSGRKTQSYKEVLFKLNFAHHIIHNNTRRGRRI